MSTLERTFCPTHVQAPGIQRDMSDQKKPLFGRKTPKVRPEKASFEPEIARRSDQKKPILHSISVRVC